MRVNICTINVGGGEGNRNMAMEVLSWVDVFIFVDNANREGGGWLEHEARGYELVSFVEGGNVEVYIKTSMVGWMEVEKHNAKGIVLRGKGMDEETVRIGGVYIRPGRDKEYMEEMLEGMEDFNVVVGDFNARNLVCGEKARDDTTNNYRRWPKRWMDTKEPEANETNRMTFRSTSVLDITLFKKGKSVRVNLNDRLALEHCGQIIRIDMKEPDRVMKRRVKWTKVDWKQMETDLKTINDDNENGWESLKKIVGDLRRVQYAGSNCG